MHTRNVLLPSEVYPTFGLPQNIHAFIPVARTHGNSSQVIWAILTLRDGSTRF